MISISKTLPLVLYGFGFCLEVLKLELLCFSSLCLLPTLLQRPRRTLPHSECIKRAKSYTGDSHVEVLREFFRRTKRTTARRIFQMRQRLHAHPRDQNDDNECLCATSPLAVALRYLSIKPALRILNLSLLTPPALPQHYQNHKTAKTMTAQNNLHYELMELFSIHAAQYDVGVGFFHHIYLRIGVLIRTRSVHKKIDMHLLWLERE
jgi:hypothetical protein